MDLPKICTERFSSTPSPPPTPPSPQQAANNRATHEEDALQPTELAISRSFAWNTGTTLRVKFMGGTEPVRQKVKKYAPEWCNHANILFEFVDDTEPADIRVSFVKGNTWSFVGKECKKRPKNEATMNFGWLDEETDDEEFSRTILHEFGHALGCIHEHQNPEAGIEWDDDAVYDHFTGKGLEWSREKVQKNIFERYQRDWVRASEFDPYSIMLYFFDSRFTKNHYAVRENCVLSSGDKEYIGKMYPRPGVTSEWQDRSPQAGLPRRLDGNPTTRRGYVRNALRNFVYRISRRFRRNT